MSSTPAQVSKDEPTFDALPLSPEVRTAVDELGYVHPTPVQRAVFEPAVRGQDLVVQARTGTGKTAAFGLPLVDRLVRRKSLTVQALALCPTRELALQVTRELSALSKHTGISVLPVYGGAPMPKQVEGLKQGAQVVVGTPGRVLDHLRRRTLDPSGIRALILDECDEMLSMGFLPQILEIWSELPKTLQVLLFSATVARPVLRIADTRLKNPEFITLSGDQVGALEIEHYVYLSRGDKLQEILRILKAEDPDSAIVFCNTRDDTQRVAHELQRAGYAADWLNADLSQNEREAVMLATRERRLRFLVCTDVAARGIDISHLTHVINFDFPEATEQYVHRTGRTGRAGRMGTAISLVSPSSIGNLYYLRLEYKIHPTERQLPTEQELRTRAETETLLALAEQLPRAQHAELSLARRLLTHDQADVIIAGLLQARLAAVATPGTVLTRSPESRQSRARETNTPTPVRATTRTPRDAEGEAAPPVMSPRVRNRSETIARKPRSAAPSSAAASGSAAVPGTASASTASATIGSASVASAGISPAGIAPASITSATRNVSPAQASPQHATRPSNYLEEGISYEVRDVSAADLAALGADAAKSAPSRNSGENSREERQSANGEWGGAVDEVFINVGRDDGATTEDLHRELQVAGIAAEDTAYVRIRQRHTFVGVRQGLLERTVVALNGRQIANRAVEAQPARPRQARSVRRASEV
jgi:ATP-dependent RNA helicase DeaD